VPKPRREFQAGGMPFSGHCDSVAIFIWSMVHPYVVSDLGLIQMH
jgi:hypothetical protein